MTTKKLNRRQWIAKAAAVTSAAIIAPQLLHGESSASKCIGCGYCMPCGYGIDIPGILQFHAKAEAKGLLPDDSLSADNSSYRKASKIYLSKYNQAVSDKHQAHRCIRCWHCMGACPNQIFIVDELKHITALTDKMRDSLCYE